MTGYVDTSVLAAYYCPEPLSFLAERALRRLEGPAISGLTLVELPSALSRNVRERSLSRDDAATVLAQFERHVDGGYYRLLPLKTREYRMAATWLRQLQGTLRTLDALHLAVAAAADEPILTADRRLAAEARRLGVPVKLLAARSRASR